MESEPGVINPHDSVWTLLRMSPAFLLRDARHAMHDIFFCASLQVYTLVISSDYIGSLPHQFCPEPLT